MPENPTPPTDTSSFGARLFAKMAQFRQLHNGKLERSQWIALANQEFAIASRSIGKKAKPNTMPDEEWIGWLEAQSCYAGIDVKREVGRCQVWATSSKKVASRRRIINWLNKVERPIGYNAEGKSSLDRKPSNPYEEPKSDWVKVAIALWPGWVDSPFYGKPWKEISLEYRQKIVNRINQSPGAF